MSVTVENDTSATAGPAVHWRNNREDIANMLERVHERLETKSLTAGRLGFTSMRLDAGASRVRPLGAEDIRTSPAYLPETPSAEQAAPRLGGVSPERAQTAGPVTGHVALGGMVA